MFSEMVLFGLYSKVKVQKCSFSQCSGDTLKDVAEKIVLHVDVNVQRWSCSVKTHLLHRYKIYKRKSRKEIETHGNYALAGISLKKNKF